MTMDRDAKDESVSVRLVSTDSLGTGRLGIYAALGAATGVVPLPWVPDALVRRLRGALAQDVSARHGLSLTSEARAVLSDPATTGEEHGMWTQAIRFASRKLLSRFTPLGFLPPLRSAAHTFALGHLLNRYIEAWRTERSVRIDLDEARRVRRAIDTAVMSAINAELQAGEAPRLAASEDLRDATTQLLDGVIIATAGVPDWLVRRLNAAFDQCIPG